MEGHCSRTPGKRAKLLTPRWHVVQSELRILESVFESDPTPSRELREKLALDMGVTPRQVQVWFRNRRQRVRCGQPPPKRATETKSSKTASPVQADAPASPPLSLLLGSSSPSTTGTSLPSPTTSVRSSSPPLLFPVARDQEPAQAAQPLPDAFAHPSPFVTPGLHVRALEMAVEGGSFNPAVPVVPAVPVPMTEVEAPISPLEIAGSRWPPPPPLLDEYSELCGLDSTGFDELAGWGLCLSPRA